MSEFPKEITILRSLRGIQILDYPRDSFLKEGTFDDLLKLHLEEKFFNLFLSFFLK